MIIVILLILFLILSPSNCVLSQHVSEPGLPYQIRWIDMKAFANFSLNITPLEEEVSNPNECGVLCMLDIRCKSINVIFKVSQLICQQLSGDKFRQALYFSNKTNAVHYAIKVSRIIYKFYIFV